MGIFTLSWLALKAGFRLLKLLLEALSKLDFASDNILTQLLLMVAMVFLVPILVEIVDKGIIVFMWLLKKFE